MGVLASCAGGQSESTAKAKGQAIQPPNVVSRQVPAPEVKQAPGKERQARNRSGAAGPAAETPPPVPRFKPGKLVGLNRGGLATALGEPTLLRKDPPAEIWQYARDECVLLVFLYESAPEVFMVRHVELRRRAGPEPASLDGDLRRSCLLGFGGTEPQRRSRAGES